MFAHLRASLHHTLPKESINCVTSAGACPFRRWCRSVTIHALLRSLALRIASRMLSACTPIFTSVSSRHPYLFFMWMNHRPVRKKLVLPEPIEAIRRKLGVLHGVLDVLVSQVVLNRAGIMTIIGELEPTRVA